jgi:hypothetical protein
MNKAISSSVVSLIHHVELNKSGWREKVIKNLVIEILGSRDNTYLSKEELQKEFINKYGINLTIVQITSILNSLGSAIKYLGTETIILKEETYADYQRDTFEQSQIEEQAERKFKIIAKDKGFIGELDSLWSKFNSDFVLPLIKERGAQTLTFLKVQNQNRKPLNLENFTNQFNEQKETVRRIVDDYFNMEDKIVRFYTVRQLNAYFLLESFSLNEETIKKVYQLSQTQTELTLFLDTNFLFSMFELHDNPYNESTLSLLNTIKQSNGHFKVRFKVLPITIDEFKKKIWAEKRNLKNFRSSNTNLDWTRITTQNYLEVSGLRKKYFEKCKQQGRWIHLDNYFQPFYDLLSDTLRDKGIILETNDRQKEYEDFWDLKMNEISNDIEYQREFRLRDERYKGKSEEEMNLETGRLYDNISHDVKLWFAVKHFHRNSYVDSPKSVKSWVITLDNKFLTFDSLKSQRSVKICIDPNEFSAMLQFFIPRSEHLEEAIFSNFRLPFLYKDIEQDTAYASEKIIDAISHYENMNEDLAISLLTSDNLKQKIKFNSTVEQNLPLIKEEVLRMNQALEQKAKEDEEKKNALSSKLQELELKIDSEKKERENDRKEAETLGQISDKHNEIIGKKLEFEQKEQQIREITERINDIYELIDSSVSNSSMWTKLINGGTSNLRKSYVESYSNKLDSLESRKENYELEAKKIRKDIIKLENFGMSGLDGELIGAYFERIVYSTLQRLFPECSIEKGKRMGTYEYDFVVHHTRAKEIIIVEAKGYIFREAIKLGTKDTKESVKWFFENTFPKISSDLKGKNSDGTLIRACYITSSQFERDCMQYFDEKSSTKLKPSNIDIYYDREKLEKLLKEKNLEHELVELKKFFPKM